MFGALPFSIAADLRIVAFGVLFRILEDFLWFVINPAFGIKRFNPAHVWWHADNWWGALRRDYWIFTPAAIAIYCLSFVTRI